jgi:eukaryotic-like serine/threonine-protein kinase
MWFVGNKKDSGRSLSQNFHREKTQKINSKPPIADLQEGFIRCSQCGVEMEIDSYDGLSMGRCPNCDTPAFFPLLIKDYWLFEPLGGGGMGSVYHAFHKTNPDLEYAVKVLPRKRKGEQYLIDSLITEAKVSWQLGDHQHLNKVIDYGCFGDEYFAVFDYIEGIRLDHVIDSPVKRPEKQVILWALQILSAEQHMFNKGYLFRDLKPQNIMIDKKGNIKLIDFGLAMPIEQALNPESDQIQGSPYYIPPERIVGAGESQHSEIYSLGMVLFHILAKKPYYSAEDVQSLVSKHVVALRVNNLAGKLPSKVNPHIIDTLSKMIARNPNKRFHTYKTTAAALFEIYKKCA